MGRRDSIILKTDDILMSLSNSIIRVNPKKIIDMSLKRNKLLIEKEKTKCFVIGNGPSLTKEDLKIVEENGDSINVNFFYNGSYGFNGKYLVLTDPGFCSEQGVAYLKRCADKNEKLKVITSKRNYNYFVLNHAFPQERLYCIDIGLKQHGNYIRTNIMKPMTGSLNIIPIAIEVAIGMGYKNIYLLGCDFSFYGSKNVGQHFYDKGNQTTHESYETVGNLIRCALVQQHHFAIRKYCDEHSIIIQNITPGSLIMAYNHTCIQDIFE